MTLPMNMLLEVRTGYDIVNDQQWATFTVNGDSQLVRSEVGQFTPEQIGTFVTRMLKKAHDNG